MTNNLKIRLAQHHQNILVGNNTFASKYNLEFLVYYEKFNGFSWQLLEKKY